MAKKSFTLTLPDKAAATLAEIIKNSEFAELNPSRNFMLSYIITTYRGMQKEVADANAKADRAIQSALGRGGKYKEPALSYADKKKEQEQEKREQGIALCNELEGRVEGDICYYKKYEITAAGLVVESQVSNHIDNLSDKTVEEQYYPNKEEWIVAKAVEDAKV